MHTFAPPVGELYMQSGYLPYPEVLMLDPLWPTSVLKQDYTTSPNPSGATIKYSLPIEPSIDGPFQSHNYNQTLTPPLDITIQPPTETPTTTLRTTLLHSLHSLTTPPQIPTQDSIETLRSSLILRCYFHISQGLSNYPLDQIPLLPPFLPDKPSTTTPTLGALNSWTPLPVITGGYQDPLLLLLSPNGPEKGVSYISPLGGLLANLDAFVHVCPGERCERRYYCLYDNCVYNMAPVAVCERTFKAHLWEYHGVVW
ncbi:hypothetical protein TWF481_010779 [Arthrobotrys musiformis]|uniref:Uncharacterized protein n=1 Tax=Arthrobotrys musiformis TaxID=47236 RepID=A0AAV9W349_9PEZI